MEKLYGFLKLLITAAPWLGSTSKRLGYLQAQKQIAFNDEMSADTLGKLQDFKELFPYSKVSIDMGPNGITANLTEKSEPSDKLPEIPNRLEDRATNRINYQEQRRQANIESVVTKAAEHLSNEQEVSEVAVDEDWLNRFFSSTKEISSEELQLIWAKILAGEVKTPGSFSLRTLDIIKNLSKYEAEIITKIASFTFQTGMRSFVFHVPKLLNKYEVSNISLFSLRDIGIISDIQSSFSGGIPTDFSFSARDKAYQIKRSDTAELGKIPVILFTSSGSEIIKLVQIDQPINDEFLKESVKYIAKKNGILVIADIVRDASTGHYDYVNHKSYRIPDN